MTDNRSNCVRRCKLQQSNNFVITLSGANSYRDTAAVETAGPNRVQRAFAPATRHSKKNLGHNLRTPVFRGQELLALRDLQASGFSMSHKRMEPSSPSVARV